VIIVIFTLAQWRTNNVKVYLHIMNDKNTISS
jgi:hypothetical protein